MSGSSTQPQIVQVAEGPTIRVFDGVGVDDDGPVSIGGPRQRRLLALLAVRAGTLAELDWLAEHLWADDDRPEDFAKSLRTSVYRLRQALPAEAQGWLLTEPGGYRLDAPSDAVEHHRFRQLRATATRHREDPARSLEALDTALGLWRGGPFRELEDLTWARALIEELELDRLEMIEERFDAALALGRHTQITGELAAFTAEHRLRDRAARQHALALHRSGRTTEALRAIAEHRSVIAEESGLDPSAEMLELEQAILSGDPDLAVERVGRPLRGYRLFEEIGRGAFAVVWRGHQPSVDRHVAVKQIRGELASRPEFIRRFEAEAQLVARIEHPNIVPLIDFWRDPDSAYLVMRWLRGGTLEQRLDDGPLSVTATLRLAEEIGGALEMAHRHGIVHRDVKTSNVLLDEDGRAFLGDFGIALEAAESSGPEAALSPGSPLYAAPEQIRHEPLSAAADIFSLGVVLHECLAGEPPLPLAASPAEQVDLQLHRSPVPLGDVRADVPVHIADAVARAMAKDAAARYSSIEQFLAALRDESSATTDPARAAATTLVGLPYLGLRAFDAGDADRFFGRERLVDEMLGRLDMGSAEGRFLLLVGPSGSGKSSAVRAGLLPALRQGRVEGSTAWFTTTVTPATDPFESLEAALLRISVNPPASLIAQLRSGPRGVLRAIRRCLGSDQDRVVIVIDQLEELFTSSDPRDAADFLEALVVAISDPNSPLLLVATLRADYYDRPLLHSEFAQLAKVATLQITPLAPDELERAIVEPARLAGVTFEPGLVAKMVVETTGSPGALPLMQFTLTELFERVDGGRITAADYEAVGGIAGALAARAESIHGGATPAERLGIRRLFGRLTDPSQASTDLRRRVRVADLDGDPDARWAIERFGDARLVSFDRDDATREPVVEVAHEALLRSWPRLVDWLSDDRRVLADIDQVARAADAWAADGRRASDLYRGARLSAAGDLLSGGSERLRAVDVDFITASQAAADAAQRSEALRVRRLRRLVGAVAVALVLSLIAGGFAIAGQRTAAEQADAAELATLISRSAAVSDGDPELSILLALEAYARAPGAESSQAVMDALGASTVATRVQSLPFELPPRCQNAIGSSDGLTEYWIVDGILTSRDIETGLERTHGEPPDSAECVTWMQDEATDRRWLSSADARTFWFGSITDGTWDVRREFEYPTFRAKLDHFPTHRLLVVTEAADGLSVSLIDELTGDDVGEPLVFNDQLLGVEMNDLGTLAVAGFGDPAGGSVQGITFVVDALTGATIHRIETRLPGARFVFDDDAGELIAGLVDGSLLTIDLASGAVTSEVKVTTGSNLLDLGVRPDGRVMVVSESQVEFVDRRGGPVGPTFELRRVGAARIRPDGRVATFTTDDRTNLVDVGLGNALVEASWAIPAFANVTIVDGVAGVTTGASTDLELIDLHDGSRQIVEVPGPDGQPAVAEFVNPDGDGFWAYRASEGDMIRSEDGSTTHRFEVPGRQEFGFAVGDRWGAVAVLPDGTTVGQLIRMDTTDPGVVLSVSIPNGASARPHPDGGLLSITEDGVLRHHDEAASLAYEVATGHEGVRHFDVDAVSGRVALSPGAGGLIIVDPASGDEVVHSLPDRLVGVAFVRDGEFLVLASRDGTVRLWDVERGRSAGVLWDSAGTGSGAEVWYDGETDTVWFATTDLLVQVSLDAARWVDRACEVVGRGLTDDERRRFVPGGEAADDVCLPD